MTRPVSNKEPTPLSVHVGTRSAVIAGHILTLRPPNPTVIDAIKSFFRKLFGSTPEKEIYKAIAEHYFQNEYAAQGKINAIVKRILTPTDMTTFKRQVYAYIENIPTPPDLKKALEEADEKEAVRLFQEHVFKQLIEKGYTPPEFDFGNRDLWEPIMHDIATAALQRRNLREGDKDQRTPEKVQERIDLMLSSRRLDNLRTLMQSFFRAKPCITENTIKGSNIATNFTGDISGYFTDLKLTMQALQEQKISLSQLVPWGQDVIDYFKKGRGDVSTDAIANEFGPLFYPKTVSQSDAIRQFKAALEET